MLERLKLQLILMSNEDAAAALDKLTAETDIHLACDMPDLKDIEQPGQSCSMPDL